MRLTLRTLLAYVDDILDPDDAQDLARKIEESEFAGELLERRRDLLRKLRLGAPEPLGGGTGLDPNTVAEYLDNTLPPEHVADVERVCLESDVHLAEVAACHQVLTLVLGSPAEVEPACRRRLYGLSGRPEEARRHPQLPAESGAAARAGELPDYLRPRRRARGWVALALLAGAGIALWWWPAPRDAARRWMRQTVASWQRGPAGPAQHQGPVAADHVPTGPAPPAPHELVNDVPPDPPEGDLIAGPTAEPHLASAAAPEEAGALDVAVTPPPADETNASAAHPAATGTGVLEPVPAEVASQGPPATVETVQSPPLAWPSGPALASAGGDPSAPEPTDIAAVEGADPAEISPPVADAVPTPAEIEPPAPAAGANLPELPGPVVRASYAPPRVLSETASLWRLDPADGHWRTLAARETLSAGNRLAAWPLARPQLELGSGLTVELVGGARMVLTPPPAAGLPGLALETGRAVAQFAAGAGAELALHVGPLELTVSAAGPAMLALETTSVAPSERTSPEELARALELYLLQGSLAWRVGTAGPTTAAAPAVIRVSAAGTVESEPLADPPSWTLPPPASATDPRGAAELRKSLESGQTATAALRTLALSKQPAVRRAAAEALAALDEFAPAAAALHDPQEKSLWPAAAALLQSGIARGEESRQRVRTALRQTYAPSTADELYRLLCGVTPKELEAGLARQLAADLDHEELAVRVVAFWNLRRLSRATYGYQPEQTAAKRRQAVQRWQKELYAGRIAAGSSPPRK